MKKIMCCFGVCVFIAIAGVVVFALFDQIFEGGSDKDDFDCSRFNSSQIADIKSSVANLTALDEKLEYDAIYQMETEAKSLFHISNKDGEVTLE